jgi:hypothetical protein
MCDGRVGVKHGRVEGGRGVLSGAMRRVVVLDDLDYLVFLGSNGSSGDSNGSSGSSLRRDSRPSGRRARGPGR